MAPGWCIIGYLDIKTRGKEHKPWRIVFYFENDFERRKAVEHGQCSPHDTYISYPLEPSVVDWFHQELPGTFIMTPLRNWLDQLAAVEEQIRQVTADRTSRIVTSLPYADKLYPYQTVGVNWLVNVKRGILADEPGLGKTIQGLAAADLTGARKVLIVTINEVVQRQYERTIEQWGLGPSSVVAGTKEQRVKAMLKPARWYIIPVSGLSYKSPDNPFAIFLKQKFDVVIIDEAHLLQGRDSQRGKNALKLKSEYLFLQTGTPIWNRPDSLFNLLKMIDPARYTSYWDWVSRWFRIYQTPFGRQIGPVRQDSKQAFKDMVRAVMLRRSLVEVYQELPKADTRTVALEMPETLREAYDKLKDDIKHHRDVVHNGSTVHIESQLSAMPMLRRFCNFPDEFGVATEEDVKRDTIAQLTASCIQSGKQVLIFTWHTEYADKLGYCLGAPSVHGKVSQGERATAIGKFRDKEIPVLVAGMAALGTGVDLPDVEVLIFAECDWTPALIEQAWRRIMRITSTGNKLILFVYYDKTVESLIYNTFSRKQDVSEEILNAQALAE